MRGCCVEGSRIRELQLEIKEGAILLWGQPPLWFISGIINPCVFPQREYIAQPVYAF